MAGWRGPLLLLGFIFVFMAYYQWDMLPQKRAERIHQRQELRKQSLREMCGDKEAFSEGKHGLDDLSNKELENLIVDDNHGIIYCYIPKVACTNWKRVFFVLKKGEPYPDPMSIEGEMVHMPTVLPRLNSFPRTEMKAKLKYYTKFLFVRDPFIRLISAYRDKILGYDKYDFVGHQETLQEDAEHILKTLKLDNDIKFPPPYENMTSTTSVLDWFRTVPLEDRRKLYKLYEGDFKLFGYQKPSELLDG
ncbi:Carbohydrate sulfotransferase 12 [Nibea albiflora]|uniref:Carbohydrate sulfotransferase 12 n=1 Tax=Nibea albiflora TaxID=240163 RepID=A0ACB7EW87_NIBAL|nr:Carbohydrate sulfotransferase 12 [Nibea albiflora]